MKYVYDGQDYFDTDEVEEAVQLDYDLSDDELDELDSLLFGTEEGYSVNYTTENDDLITIDVVSTEEEEHWA